MEVILLERIERLGQMGDVVNVKNGYARNYLLPQKKALRKTKDNLAYFESKRKEYEAHNLKMKSEAEEMAEKIKIVKVDVDEAPKTPENYDIQSIPTLILFKGGQVVDTKTGAMPKSQLIEWINSKI